jgi:hypothetical protein
MKWMFPLQRWNYYPIFLFVLVSLCVVRAGLPITSPEVRADEEEFMLPDETTTWAHHDHIVPLLPPCLSYSERLFHDDQYYTIPSPFSYHPCQYLPDSVTATTTLSGSLFPIFDTDHNPEESVSISHDTYHGVASASDALMTLLHRDHQPGPDPWSPSLWFPCEVKSIDEIFYSNTKNKENRSNRTTITGVNHGRNGGKSNTRNHRKHPIRSLQVSNHTFGCIYNESELQDAIDHVPNHEPIRIDICADYLIINITQPYGIMLENKTLEIHCSHCNHCNQTAMMTATTTNSPCTIDAQHASRIFRIVRSNITFYDFIFMNGNGTKDTTYTNGGAMYVYQSTIEFTNCQFINHTATFGGAILLLNSTFRMKVANINASTNTSLSVFGLVQNNAAKSVGGFLYATDTSIIHLERFHMMNNSARWGGGIHIKPSNLTLFGDSNDPCIIENNKADVLGGFIFGSDSTILVYHSNFNKNQAEYGGGIYIDRSNITFVGSRPSPTSRLIRLENNVTEVGGGSTIQNNVAVAWYGGFLHVDNCSVHIEHYDLVNNSARVLGGFVFGRDSTISVYDSNFNKNQAWYGGAIYVDRSNVTLVGSKHPTPKNTTDVGGASCIQNNVATVHGGFLHADKSSVHFEHYDLVNNSAKWGGVVRLLSSTLTLLGPSDTTKPKTSNRKNTAHDDGGVLHAFNSTVMVHGCHFTENWAGWSGGAIYVKATNLTIGGCCLIQNNMATRRGGFLVATGSSIRLEHYTALNNRDALETSTRFDHCYLVNNSAEWGGAIHISYSDLTIEGNNYTKPIFAENNHATVAGGFLYGSQAMITMDRCFFSRNWAGEAGGAICVQATNLTIGGKSHSDPIMIEHNRAPFGGAISISYTNLMIEGGWLIQNNMATKYHGGFLYALNSSIHLKHYAAENNSGIVINNQAKELGGAVFMHLCNMTLVGSTDPNRPIVAEKNNAGAGGFLYGWISSDFNATIGKFVFRDNRATVRRLVIHS